MRYLTIKEAKKMLGIKNSSTIIGMVQEGRIRGINISTGKNRPTWRIDEDSIINLK